MRSHINVMDGICISASLACLQRVAGYVRTLAQRGDLPSDAAYRLRLAADEIVSNIILHGYQERPGQIRLSGGVEADRVWLRVDDEAPRFDPRTRRIDPQLHVPPQQRAFGGLGLYLVHEAVDDFSYDFADGLNINTLVIYRTRPA